MAEFDRKGSFVETKLALPSRAKFVRQLMDDGLTKKQATYQYRKLKQDVVYVSFEHNLQVNIDKNPEHGFPCDVWHLSIKDLQKKPIRDWRKFQAAKNELCGPEYEAIELYPAESRVVDTANQYHLFVFMEKGIRLPCGWTAGMKTDKSFNGSVQRPFAEQAL